MKSKNIFFIMLLVLSVTLTIQSCKKEAPVNPTEFLAAVPEAVSPANKGVVAFTASGQAVNLTWSGTATNAIKWDVYFGNIANPPKVASGVTTNSYTAHIGTVGGAYYWKVETVDVNNITSTSPIWKFNVNSSPNVPVLTSPADAATLVSKTAALTWTCTDPESDNIYYDVYFGTTATPAIVASGLTDATYSPTMAYGTKYYWKIIAKDAYGGSATSAVHSFTTKTLIVYDFSIYNGVATEKIPTFDATNTTDVYLQANTTAHTISMYLPCAADMVFAGWGTAYTGAQSITISYDPETLAVTSTKQLWTQSFIDPTEMGPMSLKVSSGTMDPTNKKISIKWTLSGNSYWGADYTLGTATYIMK